MTIKTKLPQEKNNATNTALINAEMAEMNESFLEKNRAGLARAVGYSQVPVLIASLGLSSKLFHAIGYQTDKYLGIDPFKNPGLAFFAVAKSAGWATESVQKFLYSRLGYVFPKTPAQILFKSLPFGSKLAYGLKELFVEGKVLTYLPSAGFHMGGGFAVSNLVDHYFGEPIEKLTNKNVRDIAVTSAFFYREIFASLAPSAPVRYLASTTAGKATGTFMRTTFAPAMAPVRIAAGIQFGYDLASGTISMLVKGSKQANYDYLLAMDAAKKHSSFVATILTPVADTYHTSICSGSGVGIIYDAYEGLKVFIGAEDERETCRHLRHVHHVKYTKMLNKQLPIIKETFREALTFAGLVNSSAAADAKLWRKLLSDGWLERVDTQILQSASAFAQQAFHDDQFMGTDFFLQFGTFAAIMDSANEAEWFRKYFDYDMLYGHSEELEKGIVFHWPIIKKELTDDFIISLGTSFERILQKRKERFASDVAQSLAACLSGAPTHDQLEMRDLAVELGLADKEGYPTDAFMPNIEAFTDLTFAASGGEFAKTTRMILKLAQKYHETGELRFALTMIAASPHVAMSGNNVELGQVLKTAGDVLEKHANSPKLFAALMPVYEKLQKAVVYNLVRQATTDKIIDGTAEMTKLDISGETILLLKDCSVIEQILKINHDRLSITDICNEDGGIDSRGKVALEKFVGSKVEAAVKSFTLEQVQTEMERAFGPELRAEESNMLLKEIRLQVAAIYLSCLANAELFGKDPEVLFSQMMSGKEYQELKENMKLAAAFWKTAGSPADFKWRAFANGAIKPNGAIGDTKAIIEWGLEAKKDGGQLIVADLNARLKQAQSIVASFDRAKDGVRSGARYLSEYLQGEIHITKDYLAEYEAQFCELKKASPAGYDPMATFFFDGVDCLGSGENSPRAAEDNFTIMPAKEAKQRARGALDIVRQLDQKLMKLEAELEHLIAFEEAVGIKFSFSPVPYLEKDRPEVGRNVAENNLLIIERTLRKLSAEVNEPEYSIAFRHLKKAFMLE